MKKITALGSNLIVKVLNGEVKVGSIIIASEGTRESMAREEAIIIQLGEQAFDDLDNVKPKVGDRVALARYEGKVLEENKPEGYELRVVADTRVLAIIEEA